MAVLEADKIACEMDLSVLTKKLSSANEDIKDLFVKCSTLEADLMKEKTTNQQLSHIPQYANVQTSKVVEKDIKAEQWEAKLKACQEKLLNYEETLSVKDEVTLNSTDIPKTPNHNQVRGNLTSGKKTLALMLAKFFQFLFS